MFFSNLTTAEIFVFFGTIFILLYIVFEVFGYGLILKEIFDDIYNFFFGAKIAYGYTHYYGPTTWRKGFPASKGRYQSPINISSTDAIVIPTLCDGKLIFSQDITPQTCVIQNSGVGVTICCQFNQGQTEPTLSGGPLSGTYRFLFANFRWGANDLEGSEHTVDNRRFAMELQVVYFRSTTSAFASFEEASAKKAIVIVSYLFKISNSENSFLEAFISHLPEICKPGTQYRFCGFPLDWLIVPFSRRYYMYKGSLTQPPCVEGVTWLVQAVPLTLSTRQLNRFRHLNALEGGALLKNTRPIQKSKNRTVYFYD